MSDRKIVHTRTTSSSEPKVIAEFVHNLTLQGYEPLYNQTRKNFGTFIITMALYESKEEANLAELIGEAEAKAPVVEAKVEEPKLTVDVAPEVKTEAKTKSSTKRVGKAKDVVATPAEASGDTGSDTNSSSSSDSE